MKALVNFWSRNVSDASAYPVNDTNRVKRLHERGSYDRATVHAILDAAALCHVACVIDGQPYCTPTLFWREGDRLYWHGSSASRMLLNQSEGEPVCVTVSHLDSLVLARSAFNHSVDYRSVMAFGHARIVEDAEEKRRALAAMINRFYPERWETLRPATQQEIKATCVIGMAIEQASAKIRAKGVGDDEEDYALPVWAERIPVRTVLGAPEPCPRLVPGVERPARLAMYREGRGLGDALTEAHAIAFPVDRALTANNRLASYGSLAPGRINHGQLSGLVGTWTKGTVKGRLLSAGSGAALGFPGLVLDPDGEDVEVHLFASADLPQRLPQLDAFEGRDYRREIAQILTADGVLDACIYVLAE
jgi:nitroimidazol reductase NimA-like FMN-containing flavoprotein (pyridoxamine 5'-phosphate oxidase superfamily)/gamma-glutamylcyclotransferase (GGCT)/AIG2-like uncharacterized protein YtfP